MATFKITETTTVAELKKQFIDEVGGTLRVYDGRSEAADDVTLVSIGAKKDEFSCRTNRTVGSFEKAILETFNLKVKVYTNDNWVKVLDDITLETATKLPNQMTKEKMESYVSNYSNSGRQNNTASILETETTETIEEVPVKEGSITDWLQGNLGDVVFRYSTKIQGKEVNVFATICDLAAEDADVWKSVVKYSIDPDLSMSIELPVELKPFMLNGCYDYLDVGRAIAKMLFKNKDADAQVQISVQWDTEPDSEIHSRATLEPDFSYEEISEDSPYHHYLTFYNNLSTGMMRFYPLENDEQVKGVCDLIDDGDHDGLKEYLIDEVDPDDEADFNYLVNIWGCEEIPVTVLDDDNEEVNKYSIEVDESRIFNYIGPRLKEVSEKNPPKHLVIAYYGLKMYSTQLDIPCKQIEPCDLLFHDACPYDITFDYTDDDTGTLVSNCLGDSMISHGEFHYRGNSLDEIGYLDWCPEWYALFEYTAEGTYRLVCTTADPSSDKYVRGGSITDWLQDNLDDAVFRLSTKMQGKEVNVFASIRDLAAGNADTPKPVIKYSIDPDLSMSTELPVELKPFMLKKSYDYLDVGRAIARMLFKNKDTDAQVQISVQWGTEPDSEIHSRTTLDPNYFYEEVSTEDSPYHHHLNFNDLSMGMMRLYSLEKAEQIEGVSDLINDGDHESLEEYLIEQVGTDNNADFNHLINIWGGEKIPVTVLNDDDEEVNKYSIKVDERRIFNYIGPKLREVSEKNPPSHLVIAYYGIDKDPIEMDIPCKQIEPCDLLFHDACPYDISFDYNDPDTSALVTNWLGDSIISGSKFHYRGNSVDFGCYREDWPLWYALFEYTAEGTYRLVCKTANLGRDE